MENWLYGLLILQIFDTIQGAVIGLIYNNFSPKKLTNGFIVKLLVFIFFFGLVFFSSFIKDDLYVTSIYAALSFTTLSEIFSIYRNFDLLGVKILPKSISDKLFKNLEE